MFKFLATCHQSQIYFLGYKGRGSIIAIALSHRVVEISWCYFNSCALLFLFFILFSPFVVLCRLFFRFEFVFYALI